MKSKDQIWDEIHNAQEWGKYPSEHVIRFVARNFYNVLDRTKIKILDFGCGAGANTWFLARENFDVYAFDGAEKAAERARNRLNAEGLSADIRCFDALEVDYEDDFFDSVIDNVCIYANTIDSISKMYNEVYRILKNNGKLLTTVFTTKTSGYADVNAKKIEEHTYTDITYGPLCGRGVAHFFEENELIEILNKIGFQNINVETLEFTDRGNVVSMFVVSSQKII